MNDILTSQGPFGDSDGTRADIKEIINGFIDFSQFSGFSGLSFNTNDKSKRVIVGKKGSGKTIYLRRIQRLYRDDDSVYVSEISYDPPKTRLIVKVSEWSNVLQISEMWTDIWKTAILRSVYSHLFYSDQLKDFFTQNLKSQFIETYKLILPKNKQAVSIYSQVRFLCSNYNSSKDLFKYIDNPLWDDFEVEIGRLINSSKPIFLFIDAIDEDYAHAPLHWLRCQKGLFYAIYRLLRNQAFGGRLHISIAIRETVMAHILSGEHMGRYQNDARIKNLKWDKSSIFHFLDKKIEKIDSKYFIGDIRKKGKNIYSLVGIDRIKVSRNGKDYKEDIKDYIIRHTRLLPRDIINIGNEICRKIEEIRLFKKNIDSCEILKSAVHRCAKAIALETLSWCSNQQTSNWMYNGAYEDLSDELYTSDQEMMKGVSIFFKAFIKDINIDRFDYDMLKTFYSKRMDYGFQEGDNPFNILWQFGLLGYKDSFGEMANREIFFNEISPNGFLLPEKREEYVFHSCLIDLINIKAKGSPVYV